MSLPLPPDNINTNTPKVERKVVGATVGAGTGTVISTFLVWVLDEYLWKTDSVPDPVVGMVFLIVSTGLAFVAGYNTKSTV